MGTTRFLRRMWVGMGLMVAIAGLWARLSASPAIATDPAATLPEMTQRAIATLPQPLPQPLPNPPRGDLRIAIISDLNSAYGSTDYAPEVDRAVALLPAWQPDVVLCGGDMVAGQSLNLSTAQIQAMWRAFDARVAAPLRQARLPFGFTLGNHDGSSSIGADGRFRFQRDRDLAAAYWQAPAHDPGVNFVDRSRFPFHYTFQQGDVFFLVWDGSSSRISSENLAWVERALASERAQQAKLRVVVGHLPLYAVAEGRDRPGEVMANPDQLRALLERYNVQLYVSGHHHAYYPGHRGQLHLLHAGLLGSGPRSLLGRDRPSPKTLTLVDVDYANPAQSRDTTFDMQTLTPIDIHQLPRVLVGHNGQVLRRDIDE